MSQGGRGGYWIDPSDEGSPPAGSRPPVVRPPSPEIPSPGEISAPVVRPRRRRHVGLAIGLSLSALVVLAVLAVLTVTGRLVVPGVSAKIFPIHYRQEIAQAAEKYDQDPYLVAAIVKAESGFDAEAQSGVGAVGLMQLMPATAEWVASQSGVWPEGEGPVLTNPLDNLELGVWYLDYLGEIYGEGSLATLAAYNGGLGNVDEWIAEAGGLESFEAADIKFAETREYVERIEHYLDLYMRVHPDAFVPATQ